MNERAVLKGLIERPQIDSALFQKFVAYLKDVDQRFATPGLANRHLQSLFDAQGATDALEKNIYIPAMVRLLTLRAIAIPPTLYGYLQWLKISNARSSHTQAQTALEFQHQVYQVLMDMSPQTDLFNLLQAKLWTGINVLLGHLYQNKVTLETLCWLMLNPNSCWSYCSEILGAAIEHDLQKALGQSPNLTPLQGLPLQANPSYLPPEIWQSLHSYGQNPNGYKDRKLTKIAQLFFDLGQVIEAACLYQIAQGKVPTKVLKRAQQELDNQTKPSSTLTQQIQADLWDHLFQKQSLAATTAPKTPPSPPPRITQASLPQPSSTLALSQQPTPTQSEPKTKIPLAWQLFIIFLTLSLIGLGNFYYLQYKALKATRQSSSQTNQELDLQNAVNDKLEEDNRDLRKQSQDQKILIGQLEREKQGLETKINNLNREISTLETDLNQLQATQASIHNFSGRLNSSTPNTRHSFPVNQDSQIDVFLYGLSADIDLAVIDPAGNILREAEEGGTRVDIVESLQVNNTGQYVVNVYLHRSNNSSTYKVKVYVQPN